MKSETFVLESDSVSREAVTRLGAATGQLWRSSRIVVAGLGHHQRGPLDEIEELLDRVDIDAAPGHGPIALAALPFDLTDAPAASVPEIAVVVSDHGASLTACGECSDLSLEELLDMLDLRAPRWRDPEPGVDSEPGTDVSVESVISPERWRDEIVTEGITRIRNGELNKVVLARELVATVKGGIDVAATVERLAATFPHAIVFCIDGFIGASPELLVSRRGTSVTARPLAGTAPRSEDPQTDRQLADDLLASRKDRSEHRITIDWFLNELLPWCSYVDAEPEPSLLTVANVHHLQTLVEGVLSAPPAPVMTLVRTLHPTPAVGGDPQSVALEVIAEIESAERGRYAGPTGWFDAAGNGAFAVSVRSAQIHEDTATLFAGVGVVAGSDPQSELAETEVKAKAILNALTASSA